MDLSENHDQQVISDDMVMFLALKVLYVHRTSRK